MKGDFKTVFGCFTAVLWKAWALTGFWVTGPQVKDLLNHEKCHSAVLRVSESSGGFCFLLSFIPRPRLLQKTLSEITHSSCVGLEAGKPDTATATSCSCRLSCAPVCNREPRICRYSGFYWLLCHAIVQKLNLWQENMKNHFRYQFLCNLEPLLR